MWNVNSSYFYLAKYTVVKIAAEIFSVCLQDNRLLLCRDLQFTSYRTLILRFQDFLEHCFHEQRKSQNAFPGLT